MVIFMTEDISLNFSVGDFITIRINKSYREGMTAEELYDATR
jgi:hypothetical protein